MVSSLMGICIFYRWQHFFRHHQQLLHQQQHPQRQQLEQLHPPLQLRQQKEQQQGRQQRQQHQKHTQRLPQVLFVNLCIFKSCLHLSNGVQLCNVMEQRTGHGSSIFGSLYTLTKINFQSNHPFSRLLILRSNLEISLYAAITLHYTLFP